MDERNDRGRSVGPKFRLMTVLDPLRPCKFCSRFPFGEGWGGYRQESDVPIEAKETMRLQRKNSLLGNVMGIFSSSSSLVLVVGSVLLQVCDLKHTHTHKKKTLPSRKF